MEWHKVDGCCDMYLNMMAKQLAFHVQSMLPIMDD